MYLVLRPPQQNQSSKDNMPTMEAITLESKAVFEKQAVAIQLLNRAD